MTTSSSTMLEIAKVFEQVFEGSSEHDRRSIWKSSLGEDVPLEDVVPHDSQTGNVADATLQNVLQPHPVSASPWTNDRRRQRICFFSSPEKVVIRGLPEPNKAQILRTLALNSSIMPVELEGSLSPKPLGTDSVLHDMGYRVFLSYGASTDLQGSELDVRAAGVALRIKKAFEKAEEEIFEDGMESAFSEVLKNVIQSHGLLALNELRRVISQEHANIESVGEALRQLGLVGHSPSNTYRRDILSGFLESGVLQFRDAASLGLSFLDDPSAIPAVRTAIEKELSTGVKESLEQTLQQLLDTQGCRTS